MGRDGKSLGKKTGRRQAAASKRPRKSKAKGQGRPASADKRRDTNQETRARRLARELKEALAQQSATADVLRVISRSAFDLDVVLGTLVESAAKLCDAERGILFLRKGNECHVATNYGFSPELEAFARANPIPIDGTSTTARAAASGAAVQTVDLLADPAMGEVARQYQKLGGHRTNLGVPLRRDGETLGVFTLTRQIVRPFTDRQIELVSTFADQAVIAIENARLFEEVQAKSRDLEESLQQQTATAEVLKVITRSTFNLQTVLDTLVESATRLCDAQDALIFLPSAGVYRAVARYGFTPEYHEYIGSNPIQIDRGSVVGRTVLDKQLVHITDVLSDPDYTRFDAQRIAGYRAVLGAPLLREGNVVGVIFLTRTRPEPFTEKQIELVKTFADQAIIAIENTRLFNETREALERQTATADILKVIASSPSNVQPVFDAIAISAKRLLGGFSSTVFRFVDGVAHLKAFTPTTPQADEILQSTFPRPVADFQPFQMAQAGEVMQIPDTESPSYELKDIARARGYRSMLFAPLMNKDVSIGFIAVTRVQPGNFAEHHVQLLRTFADQAVIAIENARLFDEVQEKTRDLEESLQQQTATAEVLKTISRSTFDLPAVLHALVETAAQLCGADKGTITRQKDGAFYRAESCGFSEDFMNFVRDMPVAVDRRTATGRALLEGVVVHIPDVEKDPDYSFGQGQRLGDYRALLGVPMLREGVPIGVIALTRTEPGGFTDKQIELAMTFADQAAIAIENVRLFEQLQMRTRELSKSLEDLRAAQDRLVQTEKLASLGQLTAGIAHEIKNPLNFVNNFSALSAELVDEMDQVLENTTLNSNKREELDEIRKLLKSNLEKVVQHGKRADSIVKNMLLHSRSGSGERRAVEINAILDESLNLAYHGARAEKQGFNITMERDFDPEAGVADVYPQEITRALLNLVSNGFYAAIKRAGEVGDGFEPKLKAVTRNLGDKVEIRIRDNGAGIPPEVREKIFNPFFTTKPAGEGTGLGLSMSHDIVVKQHGGMMDVSTEPGIFTEFIITLPRTTTAQPVVGEQKN